MTHLSLPYQIGDLPHSYQWQKLDGEMWYNIPGANKETYDYSELGPGTHVLHCIVKNRTGGEVISEPITVEVPEVKN